MRHADGIRHGVRRGARVPQAWMAAPIGLKVLFFGSFVSNIGFYLMIPYLTLYLTGHFSWSMALAGALLGVRQYAQQGFMFIGGMAADRLGLKRALVWGIGIRGFGFLSFAFCSDTWQFFAAAIVTGLGGALFEPAYQAGYARLTPEAHRTTLFSLKNMSSNLGLAVSTVAGYALSAMDFYLLSVVTGALYFLLCVLIVWKIPDLPVAFASSGIRQDLRTIIGDKPFVEYTVLLIGYNYLLMQLYFTMPQSAANAAGNSSGVAYVYIAVALTVVILQLPASGFLERGGSRFSFIGLGALFMGMGLLLFAFTAQLPVLLCGAILFAVGMVVSAPLMLEVIALFAPPKLLASYYGFNGYALAVGGAISMMAGGWLYDLGERWRWPGLPWFVCMAVAAATAFGLWRLKADERRFRADGGQILH